MSINIGINLKPKPKTFYDKGIMSKCAYMKIDLLSNVPLSKKSRCTADPNSLAFDDCK